MKICSAIKAVANQLGLCFVFKARCAQCGGLADSHLQHDTCPNLDKQMLSTALTKPTEQAAHHLEDQAWQRA